MSAVAIARTLLLENYELTGLIPKERIVSGALPLQSLYPAISLKSISTIERHNVAMTSDYYFATERVQITVYAKTYTLQKLYLAMIRKTLANTNGMIANFVCDSILPDGDGPDIFDDILLLYEQSQDFMVTYHR